MFQFTHPGKGATDKHLGDTEVTSEFQFTHPGKGATVTPTIIISLRKSFNSRTLGRVRRVMDGSAGEDTEVSIHAPWEGCDAYPADGRYHTRRFQFTHPGKGATKATNITPRMNNVFQFTHPGKGATVWCKVAYYRADKQA